MSGRQVNGADVRAALLTILQSTPEPASTRDLVDAVFYRTDDGRIGYANVAAALGVLLREGAVERVGRGVWQAVTS